MIISLVVAASENNVIGKNNHLLWHLPNDLKFFKNVTWGMPVVMGRKTFESVGKPLKGRTNIVVTRKPEWKAENVHPVNDFTEAIKEAEAADAKELYVIGGGEIYLQALPIASRVYLTRVHTTLDGDTYFPALITNEWKLKSAKDFEVDAKHQYPYSFQLWERI